MQRTKPTNHTELTDRQWMCNDGDVIDLAYQIQFNGKGEVDALLTGFGWCSEFNIIVTPPDNDVPDTEFVAGILEKLSFMPGENVADNEEAVDIATNLVTLMVKDIRTKTRITTPVYLGGSRDAGGSEVLLSVRPVLRNSKPGWSGIGSDNQEVAKLDDDSSLSQSLDASHDTGELEWPRA